MRSSVPMIVGICAVFALIPAASADGPSVVILKTKNAVMYVKVVAGAKKVLSANTRLVELNIEGRPEAEILAQIEAAAPQVVLAVGLPAARIAKKAAPNVPLVYALVPSPKGLEGAGVSFAPDPKRYVELVRQGLPAAKRLGVVYQPENAEAYIAALKQACQSAGVQLYTRTAASDRDVPQSVKELVEHVDAFLVLPDAQLVTTETFRFTVQATMDKRVPLITFSPELLNVGALYALAPDLADTGEKAGELVLHLMAGKPVGSLAMAMPEAILDYNEKSAELLSRPIPAALLEKKGKRF